MPHGKSKKTIERAKIFIKMVEDLDRIGILSRTNLEDLIKPLRISYSNFRRDVYPLVKDRIKIRGKKFKKITKVGQRVLGKRYARVILFEKLNKFLPLPKGEKNVILNKLKLSSCGHGSNTKIIEEIEKIFSIEKEPSKTYFRRQLLNLCDKLVKTKTVEEADEIIRKKTISLLGNIELSKKHTDHYIEKGKHIVVGKEVLLKDKTSI